MAKTPLKTASRALSIATVLAAGFAAWMLGTQGSTPVDQAVTEPTTGRTVEFAAVSPKSSADESQDLAAKAPPRRRLNEGRARPKAKPRIDDDLFFDDERPEPKRLANSTKSPRSSPTKSPPRVQPELGRLSGHERESVVVDDLDELDLAVEDVIQQPQARTNSQPAMVFRPADVLQNSDSARVDSLLTALQKKIDQLAQAQSEQTSSDVLKAIETLQQIHESKQNEQFEKLLQQFKEQVTAALNDKNRFKKPRRKPPMEYRCVPSVPTSLLGEAIFELEIPARVVSPFTPVPPAPAATPDVVAPPSDDDTAKANW